MFLYERVLILCKKQETTGDYNFKFEFELDGLKIEDDKSKQNRFSFGFEIGKLQFYSHHLRSVLFIFLFRLHVGWMDNWSGSWVIWTRLYNQKWNPFSLRSKEGRFLSIVLFSKESKMNWVREIKRSIISLQELYLHICSLAPSSDSF